MDLLFHSNSSARLFGGVASDYYHIHTVLDSSKLFLADWRHRALLHNTFGMHIFEQLLGPTFTRASDGVSVCTRTIVSQHILEDLGAIPTAGEFLREMPLRSWMAGINTATKKKMQDLTIEGDGAKEAYVRGDIIWNYRTNTPAADGDYIVCNNGGTHPAKFISGRWMALQPLLLKDICVDYWAEYPKGPIEPEPAPVPVP